MNDVSTAGFRRLFEPLRIGDFVVRNRIVNPAHGTALPEDREVRYLRERARGGAGLIGFQASGGVREFTVGAVARAERPDWDELPPSASSERGIAYYDEQVIPRLRVRAEAIHAEGARCYGQVFHLGSATHARNQGVLVAPSPVPDPYEARVPHALDADEVDELIEVFAQGVRRTRDAGLDAAEIHAAHGYLVNQFLSPYSNRREDEFGGTPENRMRFLDRILARSRELVDDFPIGVRLGVDGDGVQRGLRPADLVRIAQRLGPRVAYVSITGGNYAGFGTGPEPAYVAPWYEGPGSNVEVARQVREAVDVPVLVTGRINDAALAERILADGAADLVGMVRSLIADPELPQKVRQGASDSVRMCLGLSECHAIGPHRTPVACAVNASAGRENALVSRPARTARTVVIVGAGPAGMETARVAAERGHVTYLCDAERQIGGTPRHLGRDPNRRNLLDHAAYFESRLAQLGVELMLGNRVTADELIEFAPDAVVIASGGRPLVPEVPGIDGGHVTTALDVLRGARTVQGRALVVGGLDEHLAGATVAEFLVDAGCEVEYISEQVDFAPGVEHGTRLVLLSRLIRKGVSIRAATRLLETREGGASTRNTFSGESRRHLGVTVVLACGLVPDDSLAVRLRGHLEVHVIGDALAPRRIVHATSDGALLGNRI